MRVFIAVELPESVKRSIYNLQKRMVDNINRIKWVSPDSLHITLKFLGEVEERRLKDISEVADKVASKFSSFFIKMEEVGIFPERGVPRVIWVGISEGSFELSSIAKQIDEGLFEKGFPRERKKWVPHITLGRVKRLQNPEIIKKFTKENIKGEKTKVEAITLMQSNLTPQGAIYKSLERFFLKGEKIG
ncbi:RNA 2',3'-cyclic phosphodiesterase [Candidatus Aerophobetes bacterium]|uniref:RNA 2',3'-cyclic phosphodiesterase n=1 Tax=Aerophobetes bacterium TaxID=2030807 RepID=A0A7V5LYN8_UNCAE|nr:RNA 2',3'-cyclic phosphodiesterase [Candidatus Aerophobetes bacterium]HHF98236.1 RNA 2',3'-cyclic phosphodiesterase [Candidatus Aerophobetes bacterium]